MEKQDSIIWLVTTVCLGMLSLAAATIAWFIYSQKKILEKESKIRQVEEEKKLEIFKIEEEKKLEIFKSADFAQEKEREQIAKNLHDDILSTMGALIRSLDKNLKDFDKGKFNLDRMAKDIERFEQMEKDIRGISHNLIPLSLIKLGLIDALNDFMQQIKETETSFADFVNTTTLNGPVPLAANEQLNVYRICLEILNNLQKHAKYEYLKFTIDNNVENLNLEFQHNGKGITDIEARLLISSGAGLGMTSINSRLILLNGNISYSIVNDWSYVNVTIPFKNEKN